MTRQVFTLGYGGHKPAQIKEAAERLGADVFDIRFSPRSRALCWMKSHLEKLLPGRYFHVKPLGNAAYKTGGIELVNYPQGRRLIERNPRPVILMCGCKDYHTCHRATVASLLKADSYEVEELGQLPPLVDEPKKPNGGSGAAPVIQINFFFLL
jgi:hypothetical protein